MTPEKAERKVRTLLEKTVAKSEDLRNGILLVHSDKLHLHWRLAWGHVGKEQEAVTADHTFHIASIGKTMTSAVVGRLVEEGRISYDDPIAKYLPDGMLRGLHVYQGTSYADRILVRHLLNHTSGIADYFEERPKEGKGVLELAVEDPTRFWTPLETIQWAKDHLEAHFPPGEGFHYSDTGYQLLGLAVEAITGKPLHESLHELVFAPLRMKHSYQLFYSEPEEKSLYPMADIYLNDDEVSTFRSLSIDWAGGGIISNTEDLLLFIRALAHHALLKEETFHRMEDWAKFSRGIDYGYGLVRISFKDMLFFLSEKRTIWGNFGSTATYMFYNPACDAYLIGAFNHSKFVRKQVLFLLRITKILAKVRPHH